jgi:hypothetical protein
VTPPLGGPAEVAGGEAGAKEALEQETVNDLESMPLFHFPCPHGNKRLKGLEDTKDELGRNA